MSLETIIVVWLFCGAVTAAIGHAKNRNVGESFLWGAILGLIGVIVVAYPKILLVRQSLVGIPIRRVPAARGIGMVGSGVICRRAPL